MICGLIAIFGEKCDFFAFCIFLVFIFYFTSMGQTKVTPDGRFEWDVDKYYEHIARNYA
jgi:hypothetical protein